MNFAKKSLILTACIAANAHAEGSFEQFDYQSADGKTRPYVLFTPTQKAEKAPLIVFLHGAVSNPELHKNPLESAKKSPFAALAEQNGYYVLFPAGQKDATWFDPVGVKMVLGEIELLKKQGKIDENKIFLSGFSDGGSGTFYFAANHSDPFAGFIALNGSVSVAANLGKSPMYLENFNHKPLYIVNTQSDMLYPVAMMKPTIEKIQQYHPQAIFRTPEGNHELSYFPQLNEEINAFIQQHQRRPLTEISLETADDFANQIAWLKIEKIATEQNPQSWHTPYSLKMFNDKASFGISPDLSYTGQGFKVKGFGKRSTAKEMGVQIGDVILKMEQTELNHRYASFSYLASKKAGEPTSLTLLRDGKELTLHGKFLDGYEYEVFEKQPISAKIRAKLDGNKLEITTSRVAEFSLDFSQMPVKKESEITLDLNGKSQKLLANGVKVVRVE